MKCSNCSNDMVRSKAGWLCPECGHIETLTGEDIPTPPEVLASPAPAPVPGSDTVKPLASGDVSSPAADAGPTTAELAPSITNHAKPDKPSDLEPSPEVSADTPGETHDTDDTSKEVASSVAVDTAIAAEPAPAEPESVTQAPETPAVVSGDVPKAVLDAVAATPSAKPAEPVVIDIKPGSSPEKVLEESIAEIEKVGGPLAETEAQSVAQEDKASAEPLPELTTGFKAEPEVDTDAASEALETAEPAPAATTDDPAPEDAATKDLPAEPDPGPESSAESDPKTGSTDVAPEPAPESEPESPSPLDPAPSGAPHTEVPADSSVPSDQLAVTTPAEPAQSPGPTPEPNPDPQPASDPVPPVVPVTPAPALDVVPAAPVTSPETPATSPAVPAAAPLQPVTQPRPLTPQKLAAITVAVAVLVLVAGGAVAAAVTKPAWLTGAKAASSPSPTISPKSVLGAEATPTPAPADPAISDAQRKTNLAIFASAYKTTAENGFYPVTPPTVAVNLTDPSTASAYGITAAAPTALGQIRYWAGGSCTGKSVKPGSTGTRYLALQILLETSPTPYCIDVK